MQIPPAKKRKTAEDVYTLQCAVLERELVKTNMQIKLLERLTNRLDTIDAESLGLLSVLGQ